MNKICKYYYIFKNFYFFQLFRIKLHNDAIIKVTNEICANFDDAFEFSTISGIK
jgi:hypothetical protein